MTEHDKLVQSVESALESASKPFAYDEYWNAELAKYVPDLLAALKKQIRHTRYLGLVIAEECDRLTQSEVEELKELGKEFL